MNDAIKNPIMNEMDGIEIDDQPFYSNCLIEALKRKFADWRNIQLIPLWTGFHFHMMWYDIKTRRIRHFTHRRLAGNFTTLFFKGTIDNVEIDALKEWCDKNGIELKIP